MEKPVLITGGAGFIGCNIADRLANEGRQVKVLDSLKRSGAERNLQWLRSRHNCVSFEQVDVRSAEPLKYWVSRASAVIHLAAQTAVTTSLEDPQDDFETNLRGTFNVLEAVRRSNPEAPVLFASTNKVYGDFLGPHGLVRVDDRRRYVPIDDRFRHGVSEDQSINFLSPYGCSKGAADQYVLDYAHSFGLRTAVLRMSCIYGNRQWGTEDQGWVVHFFRQVAMGEPITIYGDGYQVRDILYVDDAVDAWLKALAHIDSIRGRAFNLGGGLENAVSLREMLDHIKEVSGRAPKLSFDDWRVGDQRWYVSDIRAISRTLDWRPNTSVPQGVAKLGKWLQESTFEPAN